MELRKLIATTIREYLNESTNNEIKVLQKQLKDLDNWFGNHTYGKKGHEFWDEKAEEANGIRRKLYHLKNKEMDNLMLVIYQLMKDLEIKDLLKFYIKN